MSADVVALRPGEVFHGRYAIQRRIASGGMGAVYEVIHQTTRRRCAMKLMLPSLVANADLRARFQAEATIAARIGSEHIVDVFDAGVDETTGIPFIVMELLEGVELGAMLRKEGPMRPAEAITLLHQASLALGKTHSAGIVHRDLKPENMFVTRRDDGSPRLKILDFGIARVVAESGQVSKHTGMLGTPAYMAPEQVHADAPLGPPADVFALAHVAYTMLVGELYWEEEASLGAYKLIVKIVAGIPEAPTSRALRRKGVRLPNGFDGWFACATAQKPQNRFRSVAEQVTALAGVLGVPLPNSGAKAADPPRAISSETLPSPVHVAHEPDAGALSSTLPQPKAGPALTVPMGPLAMRDATAVAPLAIEAPRFEGVTRVSGEPGLVIPVEQLRANGSVGTTTLPVSSDAVTRRIERPESSPRLLVYALGTMAAVVVALLTWLSLRASDPSQSGGAVAATSTVSSNTVTIAGASASSLTTSPPTNTGVASSGSAPITPPTSGPTATASARSTGGKKIPKPAPTPTNPLDVKP